jgi:thiamine kinase-like enzyme
VDDRRLSPDLPGAGRELLSNTLRNLARAIVSRGTPEQLIHGEPHAGNLLKTKRGLLFTDLETCCVGPVEFDIAHCTRLNSANDGPSGYVDATTPSDVSEHYGNADPELVRACWVLMLAMVAAWRWDGRDQFPDGRRMGEEFLNEIRAAVDRYGLDVS